MSTTRLPGALLILVGSWALMSCAVGVADLPPAPSASTADADPPSRVARISYLLGDASMRLGGVDDWAAATLNRPLTTGDSVWSGEGGRLELQTGAATIRLGSNTSVALLEVGSNVTQVKLTEGVLSVHVRDLDEAETFEIDTPDTAVSILRAGVYRVEVSAGSTVTTRTGMAEASFGNNGSFVVRPNREVTIPGLTSQPYSESAARALDDFDQFCSERDRREEKALEAKRLSPATIGYEDLDDYGDWRTDMAHGSVWTPRGVPAGWAPYRFGRWIWVEPWGWTWLDDAPWGFAPFHYGRWAYVDIHWVWIPGPYHRHPIYAPALVVFLGGGGPGLRYNLRISGGFGVAWFPLGPREVWFPSYRASRTYFVNVNVTHTAIRDVRSLHRVNIDSQNYAHRGLRGAVTAVPENVFRRAEPVSRNALSMNDREIASAHIGGAAPAVVPNRESLGSVHRSPPPEARRERQPVRVNRQPPPAPVPFEQRRKALESGAGRAPDGRQIEELRRQLPRSPESTVPTRRPTATAPPQSPARGDVRRDQKWEQRTTREQSQRGAAVERERRQTTSRGNERERKKP